MNNAAEIWGKTLKLLEKDITPVTISTWFDDSFAVDYDDQHFVIYTPTGFKKDIINQRFFGLLQSALYEIVPNTPEILVLCGENELNNYKAKKASSQQMGISDYTFDKFVVGSSNRFAHAAALAVSKSPASSYNPLFIYGPSGLGKTHLLYAIADEIQKHYANYKIIYTKGDDFTNELISAIQDNLVADFRNKYRMADLLLVDDIQFIAGKERTQEEFFHTFNTLHEAKKQIVLTSDRPPNEMYTLEDRLKTRFVWGLLADIQPPDYETRMAIIGAKAAKMGISLSDDVMQYIAGSIKNNVRQLEGAVKKLVALHELMGKKIDLSLAEMAIRDILNDNPGLNPTPELILEEVSKFFNTSPERLVGLNRTKESLLPRQIAMYLIRDLTDCSLPEIGKKFKRDHSTVLHSINKVEDNLKKDKTLQNTIKDLKKNIQDK